jgi:hypothetical protein
MQPEEYPNQNENRAPNSIRRAASAAIGCPTVDDESTEFTAVTLV